MVLNIDFMMSPHSAITIHLLRAGLLFANAGGKLFRVSVVSPVKVTVSATSMRYPFVSLLPPKDKDRKSTRLNSSHEWISYAVFCLKKKKKKKNAVNANPDNGSQRYHYIRTT